jgi:hypothetical protein
VLEVDYSDHGMSHDRPLSFARAAETRSVVRSWMVCSDFRDLSCDTLLKFDLRAEQLWEVQGSSGN